MRHTTYIPSATVVPQTKDFVLFLGTPNLIKLDYYRSSLLIYLVSLDKGNVLLGFVIRKCSMIGFIDFASVYFLGMPK